MYYYDYNTLNIFCDASITKSSNGSYIGCPGAIAVVNKPDGQWTLDKQDLVIENSTNNNSEMSAIKLAVQMALKYRHDFKTINIFSDSKLCICSLTEWIYGWVNNCIDGVMYNSSGIPVANQDTIVEVVQMIYMNNLKVNLYHQKGHVTNTTASLDNAMVVFKKSNGIKVNKEFIREISVYNNYVDTFTKFTLSDYNPTGVTYKRPVRFILDNSDIKEYKKLINKGERK